MDHTVAHETYAAERYILGEMPPDERDEFEDHFFDCRLCGENLQAASVFAENMKSVFYDEHFGAMPLHRRLWAKRHLWRDWRRGLRALRLPVVVPTLATLALASVVYYQNTVTFPATKEPIGFDPPAILDGATRSDLPRLRLGAPVRLQMILVHASPSERVTVDIVNSVGKTVLTGIVPAPPFDVPLDVYFPGRLEPGKYTFVARSAEGADKGKELGKNQFEVNLSGESNDR